MAQQPPSRTSIPSTSSSNNINIENGAAVPATPARRVGRTQQMTEKQATSRLLMSERKYKNFSSDQPGSIQENDEDRNGTNGNGEAPPVSATEDDQDQDRVVRKESTEYWLKRNGRDHHHGTGALNKSMNLGAGRGPDGAALARAAARGSKAQAPLDSFLPENSFVYNPLNRRVPQPSPRKPISNSSRFQQPSTSKKGKERATSTSEFQINSSSGPTSKPFAIPENQHQEQQEEVVEIGAEDGEETIDNSFIPLSSADSKIQEALMIEDLLYVLMGIEGHYIRFSNDYDPEIVSKRLKGPEFQIDKELNFSLKDSVERILPLAKNYISIFTFIELDSSLEFGTVTHALCSATRDLLKDYELLLVQLEHQFLTNPKFTLQSFWYYVEPTLGTLQLLNNLIMDISIYTHANLLADEDDNSSDGSSDSELDGSDDSSLSRIRREALGEIDGQLETDVEGGIVKGGEILSILWDRVSKMGGNPTAHQLFLNLFHRASQPYIRILLGWIKNGHLADTYDEFMVMEDPLVTRASLELVPTDDYWERRYTLRDETVLADRERQQVGDLNLIETLEQGDENSKRGILTGGSSIPSFLQPWKHKILLAGKYLNVVRECGIEIEKSFDEVKIGNDEDLIVMNDEGFFRRIEEAYQRANSTLLNLLLKEHNIIDRLRSLKHYFFFSQSDFVSTFLEQASHELSKTINPKKTRGTTHQRLQTHLGMVLASSSSAPYDDLYKEDIRIDIAESTIYDELIRINETRGDVEAAKAFANKQPSKTKQGKDPFVIELLQFDVSVKFPVSLIISRKSITRWQFLHRCLLHLKVCENKLSDFWAEQHTSLWKVQEKDFPSLDKWKLRVYKLRHKMMFFVQQVLAFFTSEIIEPNWLDFQEKLEKVKTVDQLMKDHADLLDTSRRNCMLTDAKFVEYHSRLMNYIYVFKANQTRFRDQLILERTRWNTIKTSGKAEAGVKPEVSTEVLDFISKLERNWDKAILIYKDIIALESTTDNPAALPLAQRLQTINF